MTISKRNGEMAIGIGLAVLGVVWFVMALDYEVGPVSQPGPGFFPAGLSILLTCAGVWVAANAATRHAGADPDMADVESESIEFGGRGFLSAIASLIFVTAFLERLGVLIVTGALLALLFRQFGGYRWYYALAGGIVGSLLIYLFFVNLLGVRLPMSPE